MVILKIIKHDTNVRIQPNTETWGCGCIVNMNNDNAKKIINFWCNNILYEFGGNIPYFEDIIWLFIIEIIKTNNYDIDNINILNLDFDNIVENIPSLGIWCVFLGLIKDKNLINKIKISGGGRTYLYNDKPKNGENPNILLINLINELKKIFPKRYIE